ncbi:hypothetical protein [Selenomonas ruminantium]|uniref:Uncharacterized protein n=1 Tax=Selenomonas ruminantium TaxID=971 RepID=A0A1I0YBS7_SELRU|nr:hypothetical protein [Selenomonas ruminantium]SFB10247.1 hypothetical protein SAMN05216587_11149 [Selenomonas ruminantium]
MSKKMDAATETREFISEIIQELHKEITTGTVGVTNQDYFSEGLNRIQKKYNLTDEQIGDIVKDISNKDLVHKVLAAKGQDE